MKIKIVRIALLLSLGLFQGCIGLPSLVHVEHKHPQSNPEVAKRLDSIETRLSQLEKTPSQR